MNETVWLVEKARKNASKVAETHPPCTRCNGTNTRYVGGDTSDAIFWCDACNNVFYKPW